MLQIVASLTDDTRSVNYDRNTFIIQATACLDMTNGEVSYVNMMLDGFTYPS